MRTPTVCLFYGANRNLTTLIASLLSLHPNCQVLNHTSKLILTDKKNFLKIRTQENFGRFVEFAVKKSRKSVKGIGGSIVDSHAFKKSFSSQEISEKYQARFGNLQVKAEIDCLVWKDATHMTAYLENNAISALTVAADYPNVRFILPIRNLLDCIVSNATGHKGDWDNHSVEEIAEIIIRRTRDFLEMEKQCPRQFMHLFQDEVDTTTVTRLGEFMGLKTSPQWNQDFLDCYKLKPSNGTSLELKNTYLNMLNKHLGNSPYIDKFIAFSEQIPTTASLA